MAARLPRQSQGPHASYALDVDWDKKKLELENERDAMLGRVLNPPVFYHFGISG
jgi:hypothetical protein